MPVFWGGQVMAHWSAVAILRMVCNSDRNGRILNSDYSGRSLRVLPFRRPSGVRRLSVLSELHIGESGILVALDLPESVQNHLMHMGFVPDAQVTALRRAPAGDPTVYGIDGMEIALRIETAKAIRVRNDAQSRIFTKKEGKRIRRGGAMNACCETPAFEPPSGPLRRRRSPHRCPHWTAQLGQVHTLQPPDWPAPESRQLSRRHRRTAHGTDGRRGPRRPDADRSARCLFAYPLF